MPNYAVGRIGEVLEKSKKTFEHAKILVIGATYKKDVKDLRKSPSLKLIELLQDRGAKISYHDPIIPYLKIGKIDLESVPLKNLGAFDCVVIATDHSAVNYKAILKGAKSIFDVRNVYGAIKNKKIVKL
jgi:UDP-N-acetyl-D-glucosamine dehydrogenase